MTNLEKVKSEGMERFNKSIHKSDIGYHLMIPEMLGVQPTMEHFIQHFKSSLSSHALAIEIAMLQDDIAELEGMIMPDNQKSKPYTDERYAEDASNDTYQSLIDIKKEKLTKLLK